MRIAVGLAGFHFWGWIAVATCKIIVVSGASMSDAGDADHQHSV